DVKTIADWQRMKDETGCDAVMVGRGSMGNPWVLRSIRAIARAKPEHRPSTEATPAGNPAPGPPTLAERAAVWRRHAGLVIEHGVERMYVHELRKTLAWDSRGLHRGADLR